MRGTVALFAACFGLISASANAADFQSMIGMNYPSARRLLLKQGYKPVDVKKTSDDNYWCTPSNNSVCKQFPEVVDCAPTGVSPCNFVFKKDGKYLIVSTHGEANFVVDRVGPPDAGLILSMRERGVRIP